MTGERFNELFNNTLDIYESDVDMVIDLGCIHINELVDMLDEINEISSIVYSECATLDDCHNCELYKHGKGCMVSNIIDSRKFALTMWALDKNIK